jgi:hypothetical protein
MPMITPLGVARQTTLMADRVRDAVEDANNLIGDEREERIADARLFTKEIELWTAFAERNNWASVVRHADTQHALALAALERLALYRVH